MLAVPMRYAGGVLGTLTFYYHELHRFTEAEKSTAWLLANLAAAAIGTAELYQGQRQLAEDRQFLAEASELLGSSLDYEGTLANVAKLAVPRFADWCSIDMVEADGAIARLTVEHADPKKVRWAHRLREKYPPDPDAPYGVPNVIRTGEAELFSEIPEELLRQATAETPELRDVLVELGLKSSMCVPLVARERTFGAITFVAAESGRRYNESRSHGRAGSRAARSDRGRQRRALSANAEAHADKRRSRLPCSMRSSATAPVGLAFMDTEFRYVRVNDALAKINGRPAEEHLGRTLRDDPRRRARGRGRADPPPRAGDRRAAARPPRRRVTAARPAPRNWLVSYYPVQDASSEPRSGSVS